MFEYRYTATRADDREEQGAVDAPSREVAVAKLRERGLSPVSVRKKPAKRQDHRGTMWPPLPQRHVVPSQHRAWSGPERRIVVLWLLIIGFVAAFVGIWNWEAHEKVVAERAATDKRAEEYRHFQETQRAYNPPKLTPDPYAGRSLESLTNDPKFWRDVEAQVKRDGFGDHR
jgi:hypothetical protein